MSEIEATRQRLRQAFESAGAADRAKGEKAYLKSDLSFFGVPVPTLRRLVKSELQSNPLGDHDELVALARSLWAPEIHEMRRAAVELLVLRTADLEDQDLSLVEDMIRESRTWALVDELAVRVAGGLLEKYPRLQTEIFRWAVGEDFWVRRSALLAHLLPLRAGEGDFRRFVRIAEPMLEEKEFFIRKAIGWVLRETAKMRPEMVADWLIPRVQRASGLTLREATRRMPEDLRERVLAARR